ncbi:MAG: 30S ribosomal protein S24e [archaeon]|jgi:ribosomal protein S24E
MNLDVKKNNRNELLKRSEVIAETEDKATPSRNALREKLSAMLNAPQERIIVEKVETGFGNKKATVYAKIYDTKEQLMKIEQKHMLKRNFKEEMERLEKEKKDKAAAKTAAEAEKKAAEAGAA